MNGINSNNNKSSLLHRQISIKAVTPDEIFQNEILEPMIGDKLNLDVKSMGISIWSDSRNTLNHNRHRDGHGHGHDSNHSNASKEECINHNDTDDIDESHDVALEKSVDDIDALPVSDDSVGLHNDNDDELKETNNPSTTEGTEGGKKQSPQSPQTSLESHDRESLLNIIQQQIEQINELKRNMNTLSKMVFTLKDNMEDLSFNIEERDIKDPSDDINDLRQEMIVIKKRLNLLENEKSDREQFRDWLKNTVKLDQYFDILIENGFEDMISVSKLSKEMLDQIGITKIGHQQRMLHFVDLIKDSVTPYQY